jgi:hypothetical protein
MQSGGSARAAARSPVGADRLSFGPGGAMAEHSADDMSEATTWPPVVWAARLSVYFLAQGALVLMAYAYYGFDSHPDSFALGFRIDPLLAAVNLLWGSAGTMIGFFRPRYSLGFVLAFAAFFTALAVLGSFTPYDLGMRLGGRVALYHWLIALPAWVIGLNALRRRDKRH